MQRAGLDLFRNIHGVEHRHTDQRQQFAGAVVHYHRRARLAVAAFLIHKGLYDGRTQLAVHCQGQVVSPACLPLEKGQHPLGKTGLEPQQIVGLKGLHAVGHIALVIPQQVDDCAAALDAALVDPVAVLVRGGQHHTVAVDNVPGNHRFLGGLIAGVPGVGKPAAPVGGDRIHAVNARHHQQSDGQKGQHPIAKPLLFHGALSPFRWVCQASGSSSIS